MAEIFSAPPHPYYIVTPSYVQESAGIRCLHILCHALNKRGHSAYIVQDPASRMLGAQFFGGGPDLLTPILSRTILEAHARRQQTPIVVYPEIVTGNPYGAEIVVRYVLNFPGLLGGDTVYDADEICFGYSRALAETANCENVLFIPPVDTSIFRPPPDGTPRAGSCFYADKFRKVHGGTPLSITDGSVEITRHQEGAQTPEEIARLFQTSEVFYAYENTALAIEAVLCGCPAVFIPNPYLTEIIASNEVGMDGYAWGTDPGEIARAKATVAQGAQNYLANIDLFWTQLDDFIEITERAARMKDAAARGNVGARSRRIEIFDYLDSLEKTGHSIELYPSLFFAMAAGFLRLLPPVLEREVGKFISTLGFKEAGGHIYNSSFYREPPMIIVDVSTETLNKVAGKTVYPPAV